MASTTGRARGRRGGREREMRELFALRDREGWTLRELSAASDVPEGTLSWWRSEIRRRDAQLAPDFVEVVVCADETDASGGPDAALRFEVVLGGGRRVYVPARYGLARLVQELEEC